MVAARGASQERSRQRRVALLDAAIELIAEQGMRGVSHRAVSRRAGLPPATAGYYFETSDQLIEAALLQHMQTRAGLLSALLRHADAAEGLLDLARRIARALVSGESHVAIAQYEVYLEASRRPALRAAVAEAMDAFVGAVAPLLGTLGVTDPQQGARALVALTNGLALHRLANPLPVEEDVELTARSIAGLFAAYMLGPGRLTELYEADRQRSAGGR